MRRYVTGSWFALSRASAVAIVPSAIPVDALDEMGDALEGGGIGAFIEALARATGSSVTSLPDFGAAVIQPDGMRVAVRGLVSASDMASDAASLLGTGVTGWAEVLWPTTADAVLNVAGIGAAAEGIELRIGTGVVLASAVWVNAGIGPASPLAATTSVATRQIPAVAAQAPPVVVPPVVAAPVVVPPIVAAPVVVAEMVDSQPPPPVNEASQGAEDPTAALADSGETIAAPVDEADLVGQDDGDDGFGIWGSTIAGPPPAAPLIDAIPAASDLAALRPLPDPPVALAAPAPADPPDPSPAVSAPTAPGDHDGATISVAALREMQASSAPPTFASVEDLALERRGRAVVSTGAVVTLDKNVIVGRTPRATRITGEMPHLVAVPSPQQDISRNHLEIRVTDTVVVAVDLDTTNGSVLHRPGAEPMRLHPGEVTVVVSNDVIDLGDGVTITFEDLP